jgi:hypothetical protein
MNTSIVIFILNITDSYNNNVNTINNTTSTTWYNNNNKNIKIRIKKNNDNFKNYAHSNFIISARKEKNYAMARIYVTGSSDERSQMQALGNNS